MSLVYSSASLCFNWAISHQMSTTSSLSNSSKLLSNSITSMSSSPSGPSLSMVFQKLITSGSSEGRMAVMITCSEVPGTPGSCLACTTPSLSFSITSFGATVHNLFYQLLGDAFVSLVNEFSTYVLPRSSVCRLFGKPQQPLHPLKIWFSLQRTSYHTQP